MKKTVRTIMKVTTIILGVMTCFSTLLLANTTDAQNLKSIKVDITAQNESIANVLAKLENSTRIAFAYDKNVLKGINAPKLNVTNLPLNRILEGLLKGSGYEYTVLNNTIVIGKARRKLAQITTGKIYGKILDDKGEGLPGASVKIIELNRTVSSAIDGSYSLSAEPGNYTIEVSYISFQSKRISDVQIKSAGLTQLDVVLKGAANALKGVVIQSSFKKEAVAGLYAQQKNAAGITDGISAEQIARTPDNNMGQVIKRISGVSTVDNRYIVVRGLTERYNQGMIDGIVLPSTNMNRRNFAFDVIPVEMVSSVVVNKTATPDISAEFAGGQVSVNTLDIPLENFTVLSLGTGFNSNTLGRTFKQAGRRGKYDFFGFDDGHRKVPEGIRQWVTGGATPPPEFAGPQSKLFSSDAFKIYNYQGGANQNYRLSAGRVYTLKNDQKWGFVAGLSFRNSQEITEIQDVRGMQAYSNYPNKRYAYIDSVYGRRNGHIDKFNSSLGAQLNVGLQGKNYKLGLKNIYSQIFNNNFRTTEGSFSEVGVLNEGRNQKNFQDPEFTKILQSKLEGEHHLTDGGLKFTWLAARTTVRQEVKDRVRFNYFLTGIDQGKEYYQTPNVTNPSVTGVDWDYRLFTDTRETDYNWAANLSQPFNFLGDKSLIKVGYNGTKKHRTLYSTKLNILSEDRNFDNFSKPYEDIMAPDKIGTGLNQAYYIPYYTNGLQFDGKSSFHGGYIILDQHFWNQVRVVYGIRAEKYNLENKQSKEISGGKKLGVTGENNTTFLPSVNLTYNITPKVNFRASFAKTVIRPDIRETSYFGMYDVDLDAMIVGDNLMSTKIKNSDLRLEWYPSPGELISVSGFYKSFDKPIELVVDQDADGKVLQFRLQNQKDAINYGLEIEIRKSLGFIANQQWLRNLTLFGNGAVTNSKIHTLSYIGTNNETIVENKETRALYGQSPYVINTGISYIAPNYGITLSYNYSGRRTNIIAANPNYTEYEDGRKLVDLQLFCRLMKQKMEIKMNIGNLLDSEARYYVNSNGYKQEVSGSYVFVPTGNGTDNYDKEFDDVRYRAKFGVNASLSVSYKF